MVPIVIVLICIGWRLLMRMKKKEKEEDEFMNIKTRSLDPDESVKINSDDESIPYKKDATDDSPIPSDPINVDIRDQPFTYGQPYDSQSPVLVNQPPVVVDQSIRPLQGTSRQWSGETEIN